MLRSPLRVLIGIARLRAVALLSDPIECIGTYVCYATSECYKSGHGRDEVMNTPKRKTCRCMPVCPLSVILKHP